MESKSLVSTEQTHSTHVNNPSPTGSTINSVAGPAHKYTAIDPTFMNLVRMARDLEPERTDVGCSAFEKSHLPNNLTQHVLRIGAAIHELEVNLLQQGMTSSQADDIAEDTFCLYADARWYYWFMHNLYCAPNPAPFPQFSLAYLETINLEVLNVFRWYLLRWYLDTMNKRMTNFIVRSDEIIVQLFDDELYLYSADLAAVTPEQIDQLVYLEWFSEDDYDPMDMLDFDTVCGPLMQSKLWSPSKRAITFTHVCCFTDRPLLLNIPESWACLIERYNQAFDQCEREYWEQCEALVCP